MGTGILFVYLLIAAVIAPIVWLFWWGAGSLADTRARAVPAPVTTAPRRLLDAFPTSADVRLAGRRDAITVYSASGAELSTCQGPDAMGRCPHMLADGTVPCAGHLLALPRPVRGSLEWQIPADYRACMVGSYAVFRESPTVK